ncbi:hypothetical protein KPL47_02560 [Clostridium estertheticum]|uniref:hypothetical protein n=1 Tax=Clostridium estertheticum TaxID=238834 RepID=UPI001C0C60DD|nr:hypothetical protein [Clostridium estertheticum]MBU3175244.1 hypothetical protein [Clostridium estertheticum]
MQFHIMNNGIDSLLFGLIHYKKFLENIDDLGLGIDEHFSELKFSTMAFHNAIELFTKKILYDVNELLIFTVDVSDNFIARLLHEKYVENSRDSYMDYWIAGKVEDTTYKTIEYKKSIEILKSIFKEELADRDYEVLVSLGKMRNAMTHLGYWDDFGWYKILIVINDTLGLVKTFYSKTIRKSERHFEGEVLEEIDRIINLASMGLEETWWASWEYQLEGVFKYFDEIFGELVDKVEMDIDESIYSLKKLSFKREGKETDLVVKLIPRCDAILFIKEDIIMCAINMAEFKFKDKLDISFESFKIYFFKSKIVFSPELYLEWKSMGVCQTQRHLLNQLEKVYE